MNKAVTSILAGAGILAVGYALMKTTVPNEQQLIDRLPPNIQKEAIKARDEGQKKNQAIINLIKKNAESDKPVWDTEPPASNDKPA